MTCRSCRLVDCSTYYKGFFPDRITIYGSEGWATYFRGAALSNFKLSGFIEGNIEVNKPREIMKIVKSHSVFGTSFI